MDVVAAMWSEMAEQHRAYDAGVWCWSRDAVKHWADGFRGFLARQDMVTLVAVDGEDRPIGFVVGLRREEALFSMAAMARCGTSAWTRHTGRSASAAS